MTSTIGTQHPKLIFLRRGSDRPFPDTWGIPTGSVENGEAPDHAIVRELHEETGIIGSISNLSHVQDYYIITAELSLQYTLFHARFNTRPSVTLQPSEHVEYRRVPWKDVARLELVPDLGECLKLVEPELRPATQLKLFNAVDDYLGDAVQEDEQRVEAPD